MRENPWVAVNRGASVQERKRTVALAHELLLAERSSGTVALTGVEDPSRRAGMRRIVLDSWARSAPRLDPDRLPDQDIPAEAELRARRSAHPLHPLLPVLRRLLIAEAEDAGLLVAVGDASGRLLWVEGDHRLRAEAEAMGFVAGAEWSERVVGTSAPGTAIALDHGVQVMGAEHFNRHVHRWSCTAAPVHDPVTGSVLGVIDITGGDEAVEPQTLTLIEAAVAVLETELRLTALRAMVEPATNPTLTAARRRTSPELSVLGAAAHRLRADASARETRLSLRHAEILLLLAWHPDGLSSRRLAELIYGSPDSEGTLRAELVRLRQQLSGLRTGLELLPKPYRLSAPLGSDAARVLRLLHRGSHRQALGLAAGPVLPDSNSPGVLEIRDRVAGSLREAMLADAAVDVLEAYARSDHAVDDPEIWWALLRRLPARSPKRAQVVAHLEHLAGSD
ncbi:transcriptional regulator [Leucobacter weissii]|uniref:Transcriptional regulator n=1 Tax=Leucobacter weissii TaxID=1983706 RepID=A0A939ML32_9MICO|nr:GAF domain-containing protein [Leucobacter weissii]MBO1901905.1 transcriptional regulator [Leucobacter weissii]